MVQMQPEDFVCLTPEIFVLFCFRTNLQYTPKSKIQDILQKMEPLLKKLFYKRWAGLLPRNRCVTSLLDGMCILKFIAAPTQPTAFNTLLP